MGLSSVALLALLCPPCLGFTASFGPFITVSWVPPSAPDGLTTLNISYSGGDGAWFALGASSTFSMLGGDVAVCQPQLAAGAAVAQMTLSGFSSESIVLASPSPLMAASGCAGSSAAEFSITRALAAGEYAGALALAGDARVIWAVGQRGRLGEHRATGVGSINLVTGAFSSAATLTLEAHGGLMFAAWGVLAPLGVLAARYGKRLEWEGSPPLWFSAHRLVQSAALLASLAGFCTALAALWGRAHFASPHAVVGLVIFLLGALQALNAAARPHPAAAGQPKTSLRAGWEILHRASGVVLLGLGVANIFLGVFVYGTSRLIIVAYSLVVAALISVAIWREIVEAATPARKPLASLAVLPGAAAADSDPPGIGGRS